LTQTTLHARCENSFIGKSVDNSINERYYTGVKPYKGYTASVEIDDKVGLLIGRVLDIDDVITFQAERVADLDREFHTSVDVYLEVCAEQGKAPSKPHSGKFVVRTTPEQHAKIVRAAQAQGKSMNAWIADTLTTAAQALTGS